MAIGVSVCVAVSHAVCETPLLVYLSEVLNEMMDSSAWGLKYSPLALATRRPLLFLSGVRQVQELLSVVMVNPHDGKVILLQFHTLIQRHISVDHELLSVLVQLAGLRRNRAEILLS